MSNTIDKRAIKYYNLSPLSDLKNDVYFEALNEKLNDNSIKNIAIIGPYGSGKSSILESFILTDTKNNYLRISLANFCETTKITDELEKKIEEQILQQLFYQLSHDSIPFSGFKKISHINHKSLRKLVLKLIIWLFSLAFIPGIFKTMNQNILTISSLGWSKFCSQISLFGTVFNILILSTFSVGLYYILKEIIRLKQKGQFRKLVMKTAQLELAEDSALNKYIDELIYFFEATEKNVVIIEDLDRFNSIVLFSKLKEVNFLINNSPKVTKSIKFVYAIKDDIFTNNYNRTKFFDFILPIVPTINTTNSGDKLREMLIGDYQLASSYINDISLYLHDMRFLKNIVNEFMVYNDIINNDSKKKKANLFSLILYKNLFPQEFSIEHSGEGLLNRIFKEKKGIILKLITKDISEKLTNFETQKSELLAENVLSQSKLREEYIIEIQKNYSDIKSICNYSISEILKEENFNNLLTNPKILCYYNFDRNISFRLNEIPIDFDQIQKKVNPTKTYEQRRELIKRRDNDDLVKIELETSKIKKEVETLNRKKLFELIKLIKDNSWESIIIGNNDKELTQEQKLLMLLLRKGYIDENYLIYISYFYVGALSLKDFDFLLNVKNNEGKNFDIKLSNVNEIIARISDDEYEYEATLNKDIITNLLTSFNHQSLIQIDILFQQFEQKEGAFEEYLLPLISHLKRSKKELQRFIELLVSKYYPQIWKKIEEQNFDETKKDELLKLFLFLSEKNIQILNSASGNDTLKNYLSAKSDFFEIFYTPSEIENLIRLIKALDIKFQKLRFNQYDSNQVFNYIFQKKHYELNTEMLHLMLFHKYNDNEDKFNELFYNENFTCFINSSEDVLYDYVTSNLNEYIENIYLRLESKQNESEDAISTFMDLIDEQKDNKTLFAILDKISTQIIDLKKFGQEGKWSLLFEKARVQPNWNNLIYYYNSKDKTINKTIKKWLNNEDVYKNLALQTLNFGENIIEKDSVTSLQKAIMECDELENHAYELILGSFPFSYPEVKLEELSVKKITLLIKYKKLIFNKHYYNQLIDFEFHNALLLFTINNLHSFLEDYSNYDFSLELNEGLLETKSVNINDKLSLIKLISIEDINDSNFANSICEVLISTNEVNIEKGKIIQAILKSNKQTSRLIMFDKFLQNFRYSEISLILESLGGVYKKASILRKRPSWENNKTNLSIAQKLKNKGYFHTIEIDKNRIKIVVRYS